MNSKTTTKIIAAMLVLTLAMIGAWYHAHQALQDSRARFIASSLEPMTALLKENEAIITELQADPFVEKDHGILESYLIKIRRDGVAKNAPMKQRLDQLAEKQHGDRHAHQYVRAARKECGFRIGGEQIQELRFCVA
jgi:hypothetical protein